MDSEDLRVADTPTTEAAANLSLYVYGVLIAFMEPSDPRIAKIRASAMEHAARIEAEALRGARERVAALPSTPYYSGDEDEGMCPNCLAPWKCNGPHEPPEREPAGYEIDRAAALAALDGPSTVEHDTAAEEQP
jgi:hypothetical protein